MVNTDELYEAILEMLKRIPLEEYTDEEKELQPYLETEISQVMEGGLPGEYEIKRSTGGKNRPRVDLLGTNFWPDEISEVEKPLLAVEVKLAKDSLATAVTTTIGQCLIYKLKYKYVIGFIRNQAKTDPRYNEFDGKFWEGLKESGFSLIIR